MELKQTIYVKSFLDLSGDQLRGCTREEGQALFTLAPRDLNDEPIPTQLAQALEKDFLLQILRARLAVANVTLNPYLQIMLTVMMNTPGKAVLWAHTLLCLARKLDKRNLKLVDFVSAFPDGFPTDDAMRETWDAQKHREAPAGNLLDTSVVWNWEFAKFEVEIFDKRAMDLN